ncbi:acyl carrier protein [Alicyclobacillus tolerans]|uniref:acyl carrier protein n=1 Tax=Alicyclobacillus tolerans TaxID=90970 RepID=UPI003B7E5CAB
MGEKLELTLDGLRKLIIERLNLDMEAEEIGENDSLQNDLGLDSIDLLEIAIGIEKTYQIKITQKDTQAFKTLRTLFDFCQSSNPIGQV